MLSTTDKMFCPLQLLVLSYNDKASDIHTSDCNPGISFSNLKSKIQIFVNTGSQFWN